jgi:hypothetical protein
MKRASHILLLLIFTILSPINPSFAEDVDPCAIVGEEIINLRAPEFDRSLRWKRTYGVEGEDKAISLVPLADQGFVTIGMTTPAVKNPLDGTLAIKSPLLYANRHDKTGKMIWEKNLEIKDLVRVADATVIKDRIIVATDVGTADNTKINLISLDGLGQKISDDIVSSSKDNLSARALIADAGGASVTIAASVKGQKKDSIATTKIIRRSLKGTTLFDRVYLADIPTQLQDIQKLPDNTIVAVGRARISGDRMGGWILHIDNKGNIITSQLFPRGRQAQLNKIITLNDGSWLVAGRVIASDTGANSAAWVMRTTPDGNPIWQHYVRGTYNFDSRAAILLADGRAQILIEGTTIVGKEDAGRDHARILTYTPEGRMTDMESFIEGSNATATDLLKQGEFRILAGRAQTGFSNADKKSDGYNATYDIWVAGLPLPKDTPSTCGTTSIPSLTDLE